MRDFKIEHMRGRLRYYAMVDDPHRKAYIIRVYAPGVLPRWRVDVRDSFFDDSDRRPLATGHYTNAATVERVVNYFIGLIEEGRMA